MDKMKSMLRFWVKGIRYMQKWVTLLLPTTLSLGIILLYTQCQLVDSPESMPAYLHVTTPNVQVNLSRQGTKSHAIEEIWVTDKEGFLGAYPTPSTFPLLLKAGDTLSLEAGIKNNGIRSAPEIYPFFQPIRYILPAVTESPDTLIPVFSYKPQVRFSIQEGFETASVNPFNWRQGNDSLLTITTEAFEGSGSACIRLTEKHPVVELVFKGRIQDLPNNGSPVYVELNYKSEVPVLVGLLGYTNDLPGVGIPLYDPGINPKGTWGKIYINLTPLTLRAKYDEYQLVIQAFIPTTSTGALAQKTAKLWLDNIKLLHF